MKTGSTRAGLPLAPDDASEKPDVAFKKQVLKLGLDGSSLPRLVVVTGNNIYICLPSGGITRTIAIAHIERVTLCPREDMVGDEHDNSENEGGGTVEGGSPEKRSATPPSSSSKTKKEQSRSPSSFFASFFSLGENRCKSAKRKESPSWPNRKEYKQDVDEAHPASPANDVPASSQWQTSSCSSGNGDNAFFPSLKWAVIATLGIAFEAPLALQFLRNEDGMDFVAALRASPQISNRAVFNMPDEDGPTNAAGERIFAAPPRREDPVVPRILEREKEEGKSEREHKEGKTNANKGVSSMEEVELSPSSPRSATIASPPFMPVSPESKAGAYSSPSSTRNRLKELITKNAVEESDVKGKEKQGQRQPTSEAEGANARALCSQQQVPPHSPLVSAHSSPTSSKTSSVQIAQSAEIKDVANGEKVSQGDASKSEVVLTPPHDPTLSSPAATAQLPLQPQLTQPPQPKPITTHSMSSRFDSINYEAKPERRTPSPLRAVPLREAPLPPPLQHPGPSSSSYSSDAAITAEQDGNIVTRRVLHMEDNRNEAAVVIDFERLEQLRQDAVGRKTSTMREAIRDSEACSDSPSSLFSCQRPLNSAMAAGKDCYDTNDDNGNFSRGEKHQRPHTIPNLSPRSSPYHLYRAEENDTAVPGSNRPLPPAGLNATYHATAPTTVVPTTTIPTPAPAAAASPTAVVRTPAFMNTLQVELAEQAETVACLRRSLLAQEALLVELADVKNELRSLRAVLAERDKQCAEWQAAYTQAEEHIETLRREQEHLLAQHEERLRAAHREELEAVQDAFEEYDTRMTTFVDQLQQDHRDEAAQWQHERRTLHHQIEELHQQKQQQQRDREDLKARAREVAEAAAWEARQRQARSPLHSPSLTSYVDPSIGCSPNNRHGDQPTGNAENYADVRGRAQEKVDAYVAQRLLKRQATNSCLAASPQPQQNVPRGSVSSPRVLRGPIAGLQPTSASPWPQPRSALPPVAAAPPSSHLTVSAHRIFDNLNGGDGVAMHDAAQPVASGQPRYNHSLRGESLIQTPPSSSLEKSGERENGKRDAGVYVPHRRSFV